MEEARDCCGAFWKRTDFVFESGSESPWSDEMILRFCGIREAASDCFCCWFGIDSSEETTDCCGDCWKRTDFLLEVGSESPWSDEKALRFCGIREAREASVAGLGSILRKKRRAVVGISGSGRIFYLKQGASLRGRMKCC